MRVWGVPVRKDSKGLLTAKEVAAMLAVKTARVYELVRNGSIKSVRVGRRQLRFRKKDVGEFVRRNTA